MLSFFISLFLYKEKLKGCKLFRAYTHEEKPCIFKFFMESKLFLREKLNSCLNA